MSLKHLLKKQFSFWSWWAKGLSLTNRWNTGSVNTSSCHVWLNAEYKPHEFRFFNNKTNFSGFTVGSLWPRIKHSHLDEGIKRWFRKTWQEKSNQWWRPGLQKTAVKKATITGSFYRRQGLLWSQSCRVLLVLMFSPSSFKRASAGL